MPEQEAAVSASASERTVVQMPSDLTNMWHRLRHEVADQIADEYDEDETPLPVDLELEVEMTVHFPLNDENTRIIELELIDEEDDGEIERGVE